MRSVRIQEFLLAVAMAISPGLSGQQAAAVPGQPSRGASQAIHLLVLQGQNAINSLPSRTAADPAVQVLNYLDEPVEGVEVTFEVAPAGPGGVFENQKNSFTTRTDSRGQAAAVFTPNTLPGAFTIRVIARLDNQTAEANIKQTNSATQESVEYSGRMEGRPWYKNWKWWTVIAAGAGAGGYFGYRAVHDSSGPNIPTISLTPGSINIGGPQ